MQSSGEGQLGDAGDFSAAAGAAEGEGSREAAADGLTTVETLGGALCVPVVLLQPAPAASTLTKASGTAIAIRRMTGR